MVLCHIYIKLIFFKRTMLTDICIGTSYSYWTSIYWTHFIDKHKLVQWLYMFPFKEKYLLSLLFRTMHLVVTQIIFCGREPFMLEACFYIANVTTLRRLAWFTCISPDPWEKGSRVQRLIEFLSGGRFSGINHKKNRRAT